MTMISSISPISAKISNISTEAFVHPGLSVKDADCELMGKIDHFQQHALKMIFSDTKSKIQALAIKVTDLKLNKEIAYLYATAIDDVFSLDLLCVKKSHRNLGIGAMLLDKALQQALDWKMKEMKLCTYEFQAPNFYSKRGFKKTSEIPNALENFSLDFFEKKLTKNDRKSLSSDSGHFKIEMFTEDNFQPSNLYNEPKSEIRRIYDKSISGLVKYNLEFLKSHDNVQREYKPFAIISTDTDTGMAIFVITGYILSGGPQGSILSPDTIGRDPKFALDQMGMKDIHKAILKTAQQNQCSVIVPYDSGVEAQLEQLGFSPTDTLPLRKKIQI